MIINVEGKNSPFAVHRIELEQFGRYSIRLIAIHGVISSYVHGGVYKICSNLIDRENGNSERVLAYLRLDRKTHILEFTPTLNIWYKLRLTDFSSLDVTLHSITTDEKIYFSEFACQFEIIEDERFQQFYSNSKSSHATCPANFHRE